MTKLPLTLALVLASTAPLQAQYINDLVVGGTPAGNEQIQDAVPYGDDSFLVGAYYSNTLTLAGAERTAPGGRGVALMIVEPDLSVTQAYTGGGSTGDDLLQAVATDAAGNIYALAEYRGSGTFAGTALPDAGSSGDDVFQHFYVVKIDPLTQSVVWLKTFGGNGLTYTADLAVTAAGEVYVTGFTRVNLTFGATTLTVSNDVGFFADAFIAKLDAQGDALWAKNLGTTEVSRGGAVAVDGAGGVYWTGRFVPNATFGTTSVTDAASDDGFLAKLDGAGNYDWVVEFNSPGVVQPRNLTTTANGDVLVVGENRGEMRIRSVGAASILGTNAGDYDLFLARYSSAGVARWLTIAGGTSSEGGYDVAEAANGELWIAGVTGSAAATWGSTTLTGVGSFDAAVAVADADGNMALAQRAGSDARDVFTSVAISGGGSVLLGGGFRSTAAVWQPEFAEVSTGGVGNSDYWLLNVQRDAPPVPAVSVAVDGQTVDPGQVIDLGSGTLTNDGPLVVSVPVVFTSTGTTDLELDFSQAAFATGTAYSTSFDGSLQTVAPDQTLSGTVQVSVTEAGVYADTYTVPTNRAAGSVELSFSFEAFPAPVATSNIRQEELQLFPNPASNTVSLPRALTVQLFDSQGRQLLETTKPIDQLDVSTLTPGLYVVKAAGFAPARLLVSR